MNRLDQLASFLGKADKPWPDKAEDWERLLSQARRARLMGRLGLSTLCEAGPVSATMPAGAKAQLDSAILVGRRIGMSQTVEAERLAAVLAHGRQRTVLLKGAAYLCARLPPARGRLFGDFDILVPQADLQAVESCLMAGGWISMERDAYNQRYYRQWMHEIPPLTHVRRGSTVDVHHTIAPPTSAFAVDGALLLAAARPVGDGSQFWVLQPVDMVLHSAVHLMSEGEFDHGLRDLLDLLDLLRHFGQHEPGFWVHLLDRADQLRLQRPLHHVLTQIERLFGSCVPADVQARVAAMAPLPWQRWWMNALFTQVLRPNHPSCDGPWTGLARWLMYMRSHALRMPLRLLVPHLIRKAWMSHVARGPKPSPGRAAHDQRPAAADQPPG